MLVCVQGGRRKVSVQRAENVIELGETILYVQRMNEQVIALERQQ